MNRSVPVRLIDELTGEFSENQREEYEERAAVMEFDGGMTRECAEFVAAALVLLLHHSARTGLYVTRVGARHGLALAPARTAPPGARQPKSDHRWSRQDPAGGVEFFVPTRQKDREIPSPAPSSGHSGATP